MENCSDTEVNRLLKICNLLSYIWTDFPDSRRFTSVSEWFFAFSAFRRPTTGCFQRFSLIACKRNAVFRNFWWKTASDGLFSTFFAHRLQAKRCFSRFLYFAYEQRMIFSIFWLSLVRESRFSLISCFPPCGKADFRWFFVFPRAGKPFSSVF